MDNFNKFVKGLENKIKQSYTEGVTLEAAEQLAGEFLHAQITISEELKAASLNARMRKTGVKALKGAVYLAEVAKVEKKPSDTMLEAIVSSNELVQGEQNDYDKAEVEAEELERIYHVAREAHIHFRGIAKGKFD